MSIAIDISALVKRNPKIRRSCPVNAGTGTSVRRVAVVFQLCLNAVLIAFTIVDLALAEICSQLTDNHANRDEIEPDLAGEPAKYGCLADCIS